MSEELVFIGGPMDGFRNKHDGDYTHVTVPVMKPGNFDWSMWRDPPPENATLATMENVTYRRERIVFGPTHVDFLVAADLTAEQALRRVFDRYSTRKLS